MMLHEVWNVPGLFGTRARGTVRSVMKVIMKAYEYSMFIIDLMFLSESSII